MNSWLISLMLSHFISSDLEQSAGLLRSQHAEPQLTGILVKATELASEANRLGPGDVIVTPLTAVGFLVRPFSTELLVVPPSASLSLLIAVTAVAKVMADPSLQVKPVESPAI